jgi:hypothetical protein
VKEIRRRALKLGLIVSLTIGAAAFLSSGLRSVLADAYLIAIGGVLLLALVRAARVQAPVDRSSEYEAAAGKLHLAPADTGELALTHELDQSIASEFHLHIRLRPLLREIAASRLRLRHGVDLAAEPERARELVGPHAWELVDAQRSPPQDRLAPGPSLAYLRDVIDELERL